MARARWTDPTGLLAQARRPDREGAAELFGWPDAMRSRDGRATADERSPSADERALRAAASLGELLERVRRRERLTDERLVDMAWHCFAAGFAASEATVTSEADPPLEEPASLAWLVAELSPRRREVLQLVAKGLTNREIAATLGISAYTVKAHVAGTLAALGLSNRTEAAVALREYEAELERCAV